MPISHVGSASLTGGDYLEFSGSAYNTTSDFAAGTTMPYDLLVVTIIGYSTSNTGTIDYTVQWNGTEMTPFPMAWGDNDTGLSSTGHIQHFVLANPVGGTHPVYIEWTLESTSAVFRINAEATLYRGVDSVGGHTIAAGTESGSTFSLTMSSAAERMIHHAGHMEPLFSTAVSDYNQTLITYMDVGQYCQGVVGYAPGASSVTFTASRVSGADYAGAAFEMYPLTPQGAMSASLRPVLASLPAAQSYPGTLGAALGILKSVMTGGQSQRGSVASQLSAVTASLTGEHELDAAISADLQAPAAGLVGENIPADSALAALLATPTAGMSGVEVETGSMGATLANPLIVGYGAQPFYGGIVASVRGVDSILAGSAISLAGAMAADLSHLHMMAGRAFQVFESGTVFTLSGLCFNLYNDMPEKFQGRFASAPYNMVQIKYPASLKSTSISDGVAMLDAAVRSTPGKKIVLAQSQGAQVVSHWLALHWDDDTAPPADELMFILTGNPLRSTGGGGGIGTVEVGETIGEATLTNTRWHVIDFARRYDGWADSPADHTNVLAMKNADKGKSEYHTAYDEPDLFDPSHIAWNFENTTYVLTQEDLPYLKGQWWVSPNAASQMKEKVEEAYQGTPRRPADDVPVVVTPTENWFWKWVLEQYDIDTG
ncbi:PE-PPE domain-containing protein [Mycolicibacterium palauense]|uniref:PE-PPE domain-containing protein n=1 Tax=Mycolicibacterium palauense TaxID=2034511 RepID=UPI000BFEC641|nr:PE-PPE domain-containing protein [Mycolicibacterium palauense]